MGTEGQCGGKLASAGDLATDAALGLLAAIHRDDEYRKGMLKPSMEAEGFSGALQLVVLNPLGQAFEEAVCEQALPTLQQLTSLFDVSAPQTQPPTS